MAVSHSTRRQSDAPVFFNAGSVQNDEEFESVGVGEKLQGQLAVNATSEAVSVALLFFSSFGCDGRATRCFTTAGSARLLVEDEPRNESAENTSTPQVAMPNGEVWELLGIST